MQDAISTRRIAEKFESLRAMMDERMRRQWAVAEAHAYGWGGVEAISAADWNVAAYNSQGTAGAGGASEETIDTDSATLACTGSGTEAMHGRGQQTGVCTGTPGRSRHARRSSVAASLDLQKHHAIGERIDTMWTSRQPEHCGAIAQSGWIQFAEQSQN
jgi:hypothetical protein